MARGEIVGDAPSFNHPQRNGMSMIVVVGITGAGKSYLINRLAGRNVVEEGGQLGSCTQRCQMIPVKIGNTKTLLIDTPGFDDTKRSDADILNEIADVLTAQYALGFKLQGVFYVHRITDMRFQGCNVKTLEIFKRICGDEALKNVLLITSRWDKVDEATGADRERQLREDFWAYMLGHGSCMSRFHGDRTSAISLASQLLVKETVVLRLQHEIINEGKTLNMTAAGAFVDNSLENAHKDSLKQRESLQKHREELQQSNLMRRKWEADWAQQQAEIQSVEKQQSSLRRNVVDEAFLPTGKGELNETGTAGLNRRAPGLVQHHGNKPIYKSFGFVKVAKKRFVGATSRQSPRPLDSEVRRSRPDDQDASTAPVLSVSLPQVPLSLPNQIPRKDVGSSRQQVEDDVEALEDRIYALEQNCAQLQRQNDAMQAARDAREDLMGRQEPDSSISAQFSDIMLQIKSWVSKYCKDAKRPFEVEKLDPQLLPQIRKVIPRLRRLEDLPEILPPGAGGLKSRRKFIRGWVALVVTENLFRSLPAPTHGTESGSDVWIPEKPRNALKSLEMTLLNSGEAITASTFHEWRTLTFSMFGNLYPRSHWSRSHELGDILEETCRKVIQVVWPLISDGTDENDMMLRLEDNVFFPAIGLSQVLRRQRACCEYTKPYLFQPGQMKDVDSLVEEEDDGSVPEHCLKVVDTVITPGLYKSGNHDGEQYDVVYPVEFAEVTCNESRD
ncbi:hypothetical protein CkaCkLH20_07685 [Colletotrichum karsti]|uniref:AIG1-type G domain-containing protein n=1 Tax=Colletotrichum karsti TaxID=1095194 RepID=A0A9P6I4Q7_9PEZI|nr:uncharacterized protein CkaCkLH20_07685 [Colletotrichum karsti]KAF9874991.1 hypothetical protein CkaCkLH20_07685 [Colletotrichum karsti]